MLVEDDPAHAELTQRSIEEIAPALCEFVHVEDGQAAIEHLHRAQADGAENLPDLVLLDLRLPRLDGLEVLEHVQADTQLKRIPIIVLTTSAASSDIQRAFASGASSYLVKPFGAPEFFAAARVLGCPDFKHRDVPV
jgi:CheY-like chemotaxis protein